MVSITSVYVPLSLAEKMVERRRPVDVIVAVDTSRSMQGKKLEDAKEMVRALVDRYLGKRDQLGLVVFSRSAEVLSPLASNSEEVGTALQSIEIAAGSNMAAGLQLSAKVLAEYGRHDKSESVVIVLTDGLLSMDDALARRESAAIQRAGAHLIFIGLGADVDREQLLRVAEPDGRVFVISDQDNTEHVLQAIGRLIECESARFWGRRCY